MKSGGEHKFASENKFAKYDTLQEARRVCGYCGLKRKGKFPMSGWGRSPNKPENLEWGSDEKGNPVNKQGNRIGWATRRRYQRELAQWEREHWNDLLYCRRSHQEKAEHEPPVPPFYRCVICNRFFAVNPFDQAAPHFTDPQCCSAACAACDPYVTAQDSDAEHPRWRSVWVFDSHEAMKMFRSRWMKWRLGNQLLAYPYAPPEVKGLPPARQPLSLPGRVAQVDPGSLRAALSGLQADTGQAKWTAVELREALSEHMGSFVMGSDLEQVLGPPKSIWREGRVIRGYTLGPPRADEANQGDEADEAKGGPL